MVATRLSSFTITIVLNVFKFIESPKFQWEWNCKSYKNFFRALLCTWRKIRYTDKMQSHIHFLPADSRLNSVFLTNNEVPRSWRRFTFNDYSMITIICTTTKLYDNALHERIHNATRAPGIWSASENELSSRARAHSGRSRVDISHSYAIYWHRVNTTYLSKLPQQRRRLNL